MKWASSGPGGHALALSHAVRRYGCIQERMRGGTGRLGELSTSHVASQSKEQNIAAVAETDRLRSVSSL